MHSPLRLVFKALIVIAMCLMGCSTPPVDPNDEVPENRADVGVDGAVLNGFGAPDLGGVNGGEQAPDATQMETPFSDDALAAAAAYSAERGGSALLVWRKGEIIFEDYSNGVDATTAVHIFSATKAFWAVGLAAALEDGLLSSLDMQVASVLTEWQDTTRHPGKDEITLTQLAALSSGLSQDFQIIGGPNPEVEDIYQHVVDELEMRRRAGVAFSYGPSNYYVFGVLLDRLLIASGFEGGPLAWLKGRVLDPIGLEYALWLHDGAGNPFLPNGAHLTARQLVKLGIF